MIAPRLLPATAVALGALLLAKSVGLVRAAMPEAAPAAAAPAVPAVAPGATPGATKDAPPKVVTAAPPEPAAPPTEPAISPAERDLLLDLRKRRAALDQREAAVAEREAVAQAAQTRLAARLDELTALQQRLQALEAGRREREEAGWRGIVRTYEAMKPRDAAAILNDLDMPVLLAVMDRMKEAKAAAVLAAMLPDRARALTAELSRARLRANQAPEATPVSAPATALPTH